MVIKKYTEFLESYGGNLPQFVFRGVNYGDGNKNVGDHFGKKNGHPEPQPKGMDSHILDKEGNFYTQDDVKDLLSRYDIWAKQNGEKKIPTDKMDSETVSYITNLIG